MINKKVLLREGKRHVLTRFADQSPDWGGGGPSPVLILDGVPPPPSRMGQPITWTWDEVLPHLDLGWGSPPPASVNRLKILPSLILRMRAVTNTLTEI